MPICQPYPVIPAENRQSLDEQVITQPSKVTAPFVRSSSQRVRIPASPRRKPYACSRVSRRAAFARVATFLKSDGLFLPLGGRAARKSACLRLRDEKEKPAGLGAEFPGIESTLARNKAAVGEDPSPFFAFIWLQICRLPARRIRPTRPQLLIPPGGS